MRHCPLHGRILFEQHIRNDLGLGDPFHSVKPFVFEFGEQLDIPNTWVVSEYLCQRLEITVGCPDKWQYVICIVCDDPVDCEHHLGQALQCLG
ncbi:hypothetical protein GCM10009000_078190 [Halobacterium noricense]|uniref:Uncharacterized protein n=1 Tax=Haladaptatus pallidirubidus TaxID=1008152 RepID=A0AAV3UMV3_9EURY